MKVPELGRALEWLYHTLIASWKLVEFITTSNISERMSTSRAFHTSEGVLQVLHTVEFLSGSHICPANGDFIVHRPCVLFINLIGTKIYSFRLVYNNY